MVTSRATSYYLFMNHEQVYSGQPNKRMRQTLLSFANKAETPVPQITYSNSVPTQSKVTAQFLKCMRLDEYISIRIISTTV